MVPAGPWRGLLLPASRVQLGKWRRAGASPAAIAAWVEGPGGRPCQGVGVCRSSFFPVLPDLGGGFGDGGRRRLGA
jgi:hypothetical protein